jgi:aspartate carbamoyltransferase regulatory subunit
MNTEKMDYFCETNDEYKELLSSFVATKAFIKIEEHELNENQAWRLMEWAINYTINIFENKEPFNYAKMDNDFESYLASLE